MNRIDWTRREFLKTLGLGVASLALPGYVHANSPAKKPNIILIMADDMGWGDTGYN